MLETPQVTGIFNVGTGKARSFKDLIGAMYAALGASAEHRIRRHAGGDPRTSTNTLRKPRSPTCSARATTRASRRWKIACAATSRSSSIAKTGTVEHAGFREAPRRASRQQTILCVGDLMLDDFVYGEVGRISPEAPAPVLAVKRNEVDDRRRRQCRAQRRLARRALHLRRNGRRGCRGRATSLRGCKPSR